MDIKLPEPPASAARLSTDDTAAFDAFARSLGHRIERVIRGTGPLRSTRVLLRDSPGAMWWLNLDQPGTARGSVGAPTLHLYESAHARYVVGRRSLEVGPGDVVLVPHDLELTVHVEPGRYYAVQPPAPLVMEALRARRPRARGDAQLRLARLPVHAADGATLSTLLQAYVHAIAGNEPSLPGARAALADWIADAALAAGVAAPVQTLRTARARRLEQWIETHLAEPITLDRLCGVAGVGARCLQKTFEVRHGTSPLEFVMQRRLAAARARLLRAPRGVQVIDVALDVGVSHLGRFSQRYRAAFGEPPSMTLRRRSAE